MKRRKIRRNMSEKRLLKLKRQLRKRAKKLRLGKKRTGAYVFGTLRRVRGNQMRSSFDKPVFGPGNVETRIVRTDTLTGIKEAERLVRDGWYQGRVGLFTTTYYRKRRATPQVAPSWKTGIYTGKGIAKNPAKTKASPIPGKFYRVYWSHPSRGETAPLIFKGEKLRELNISQLSSYWPLREGLKMAKVHFRGPYDSWDNAFMDR